jgi:cobalt-zinc-cadmium efflux system outer membrane protein
VDPDAGFPEVAADVQARSGQRIAWARGAADPEIASAVDALLEGGLTADEAVQTALWTNRELQSTYADLGVAQADVVQASLLHNPVIGAGAGFGTGPVDLVFSLAVDVIDLFYAPLRRRTAEADFEETKRVAAGRVLDVAWSARTAFHAHQADVQMVEMRRRIADATAASLAVAERMREAGNVTELDLARERAMAEQARLDLRDAEIRARTSREALNVAMGLWGRRTTWELAAGRLPEPPAEPLDALGGEGLETRAVEASLDLAAAEYHVVAAAENLGLTRASRFFPELVAGGEGEREERSWDGGPTLAVPLPIFDRGQARLARGEMELVRARDLHRAVAVRVRSAVREARDRTAGQRERALHYRDVLLPLRETVVRRAQLHYNAMQIGVFELLRAKQEQIRAGADYVETLRAYWMARADLELLLAGRLPPPAQGMGPAPRIGDLPRFPFPTLQ